MGKRKKNYYAKPAKKIQRTQRILQPGMKGFLVTYNNQPDRVIIKEVFNLLNEYADKLCGNELTESGTTASSSNDDIETELQKELNDIKSSASDVKRFECVESLASNCLFFATSLPDPTKLVQNIFADILDTKLQKSRFINRILPIRATCKAYFSDIKKTADQLFDDIFATRLLEGKTFMVLYKARNNNSAPAKMNIIKTLADLIVEKNPAHRVNLMDPDFTVLVEIMQNICCLGVVENYTKFKKYNLASLCSVLSTASESNRPTVTAVNTESTNIASTCESEENSVQNEYLSVAQHEVSEPVQDDTETKMQKPE